MLRERRPTRSLDLDFSEPASALPSPGKNLEPRERAFAERLHRGVLQNLRLLDALLDERRLFDRRKTDERLQWIIRMAAYQRMFMSGVPDYAIGEQSVEHARELLGERAAKFMNAVIRRTFEFIPTGNEPIEEGLARIAPSGLSPAIRYSIPDSIAAILEKAYGSDALEPLLRSMNDEETRVWLRANRLKTTAESLQSRLKSEGVESEIVADALGWLRWNRTEESPVAPWRTSSWREGLLTVQDLAAAIPAMILAPLPDEKVLDYCAAPGGKTGQIWEMMEARGELFALEVDGSRRKLLSEALGRLYGENHAIRVVRDEVQLRSECGDTLFDAVLVDAPCAAMGLLRRHPEIRWDNRLEGMSKTQSRQIEILQSASRWLKPGGRLVYATCSPTREENEEVIQKFLASNPTFKASEAASSTPEFARSFIQTDKATMRTRPDLFPVDGFAMTILENRMLPN